eukprot:CAMPEP_0172434436 /NCGR_PEP_ID=MMETSP1064-20121228/70630_1 /TAXON_ID=202472 /ORGANISM="Aulacoseira subarctica , Strain CCAP 1002/5" /LENGTH=911 /DNA_ID=CAMNT_0013182655 /DNA_START=163 /DNA_END=2900 /DNA_ORIENTATION=+
MSPNIVGLYEVEKTPTHYYLILEYCGGGDLQKLIRSRQSGRLSEKLTRRLFRDLTAGLRCLYELQLIHRDIKPQNLLLTGILPLDELEDECKEQADENERQKENFPSHLFALKLADFGFARHLQTTSLAETLCGSPLYMAPEILQHQRYDATADLWSAGAVLFEMVAGRPPFHGENHIDLLRNIQRRAVRLPPGVQISQECVNLLRILLNRNPSRRATFEQFFEASKEFTNLGCNGPVPNTRSSISLSSVQNPASMIQAASLTLHIISEESPLSESSNLKDKIDVKSSPTALSLIPSRSTIQVTTADRFSYLPTNFIAAVSSNTSNLLQQGCLSTSGNKHQNQPISHLSPLVASPPVCPQVYTDAPPPPFSLDCDSGRPQDFIAVAPSHCQNASKLSNSKKTSVVTEPLKGHRQLLRQVSSISSPVCQSQASDGDEFVMVDQMQSSSLTSYENPFQAQERRSYAGLSGRHIGESLTKNAQTQPTPYRRFCGLLSTSPGTGGQLLGAMMQKNLVKPQAVVEHNQFGSLDVTVKTLSAAEDVGRRAVNVAHLGDTRAYLAMRVLMEASMSSSFSSIPMDGVEDLEKESSFIAKARRNSFYSKTTNRLSIKEELEGDDDDEMPFAVATVASDDSSFTGTCDATKNTTTQPSLHAIAQAHFREALSCYLKALPLLRGAVKAAQRVIEAVQSGLSVDGSTLSDKGSLQYFYSKTTTRLSIKEELEELPLLRGAVKAAQRVIEAVQSGLSVDGSTLSDKSELDTLASRCRLSLQWLAAQFNGVLERAEAATSEIQKLQTQLVKGKSQEKVIVKVEELIYNHSLACGRDGAVKQLLGQYEAARSCYRSAGLLAETLLMEPRLNSGDKQILEGYVSGFLDRIREVEQIIEQGVEIQNSEVVSIVGGVQHRALLRTSSTR